MKEVIINHVMYNISKTNNYSDTKLLEIKFGLEALYLTVTKFIVIIIISLLLNVFKELVLFTALFSILKVTGFGLHAKKSWQCWITSVPIFIGVPYLIKTIQIPEVMLYIALPLILLDICLYAPADTEKRPLINKRKRLIYKIITIITTIIYILLILIIKNSYLTSILFYSLLLESILINPLSYKLFGLKYNNYLNYRMKGGKK